MNVLRSHFAGIKNENITDNSIFTVSGSDEYLEFNRGDLLILLDLSGDSLIEKQFVRGENPATGKQGNIPVNSVHVLPTMTKPTVDIMVRSAPLS